MIRNSYNVDISVPGLPQSPKRPAALASRPRSGGSESSFNFDMPKTPHFDQISSVSSAAMNGSFDLPKSLHGSNSSLFRNNLASSHSTASSNHMNFSQPIEPHSYNITNGYPVDLEEEIYVFVEPLNRRLCCPVCSQVFKDPVITTCGHTFCKVCVQKSVNEVCPIDMKPSKYIVDNIALSEQIGELVVRCKYGCKKSTSHPGEYVADESGCPVTLKISERYSHEKHCDFSIMSCPNNRDCPQFLRKDLESHLQTCTYFACPNQKNGCDFVGARHSLSEHVALCSYNSLKGSSEGESRLDKIKQENKSAREDIDFLFTSLRGLNQRFEQMEAEKDKMEAEHEKLIDHVNKMASALDEAHKEIIMGRNERQVIMEELEQLKRMSQQMPAIGPYDPETIIKCKGTCVGHDGPVWCLAADNDFLFSGSSDNHVRVWDTSCNYKCVKTLAGHCGIVLALTVNGNRLYSGSQDTKIMIWDIDNNFELVDTLDAHDNPVCTLATSRAMIFSGSLKTVKVWSFLSGKHVMKKEISGFNHWVRALYATDRELYCGSYQTIEIYNLDTFEITTTLKTYGGSVYSITVTDKYILCGTYEKVIHVWELSTMEQVTTLQGHNGTVYALTWMQSPGGILVFSASYDRTIRVWSQNNMICKQTLLRHGGSVACLVVVKGRLFSGGIDSMVKVWQ